MAKRIGIITYHRAENYGSALQAYALNRVLNEMPGVESAETIDYLQPVQKEIYDLYGPWKTPMGVARNLHSLFYCRSLKRKKKRFADFLEKFVRLTDFSGDNQTALKAAMERNDIMVCGSDQIWNASCADFDFNYMLKDIEGVKKIAYAPSIGTNSIPQSARGQITDCLSDFSAIAMREPEGRNAISQLYSGNVDTVLDPTLLLTGKDWRRLAQQAATVDIDRPYILCYFIGHIPGMREFALKVSKESGMHRIIIMKNLRDLGKGGKFKLDIGPLEFISLIKGAEMVITDSFHAVAFSHLFHTPFYVFTSLTDSTKPNSRITNILNLTGHQSRMLNVNNFEEVDWRETLDFEKSDEKLATERTRSLEWLKEQIG